MNRKTYEMYKAVFEKIRSLFPEFKPSSAVCDYEVASYKAFLEVYPGTPVRGCWFHCKYSFVS